MTLFQFGSFLSRQQLICRFKKKISFCRPSTVYHKIALRHKEAVKSRW